VTLEYEDGKPTRVHTVIVAAQHDPELSEEQLREEIIDKVINCVIPDGLRDRKTKYFINPTGRFVIGGPQGDTGCTGRKIMVDTYGGLAHHGGGCFSGKDPSKVDRSASYMARYIAKNIVKAGFASECEIQISYAIGVAKPISLNVNTFGTGRVSDDELIRAVLKHFDLTPKGIIDQLTLLRPVFKRTACYGHFGREEEGFTWERTDQTEGFRMEVS
jgi:S-adenosylmethionine synthetase